MKKITLRVGALLLLLVTTATWAPNIYAADSYLMFCRTGGNMQVLIRPTSARSSFITIIYVKSKVKYDLTNPQLKHGECAWKDRPIKNEEPSRMTHKTRNIYINSQFTTSGKGKAKITIQSFGDTDTAESGKLMRFLNSVMNDAYITVKVKKGKYDDFEITSFE